MRIELDINEIKECVAMMLAAKHNLSIKECNFTYDLVDFDEHLFGVTCDVQEITKETK